MNLAKRPLRVIYFGTARFAVPPLEALKEDPTYDVVAVVSQQDKRGNRGKLTRSPVAQFSDDAGIPVIQFTRSELRAGTAVDTLRNYNADVFIVAAYGLILPRNILDIPPSGALNLHGSLLPRYRGASPIQMAILTGDKETGVTLMRMDDKMDHGPILGTTRVSISVDDDFVSLTEKLSRAASNDLVPMIAEYVHGTRKAVEQDHDAATHAPLFSKENGRIDWTSEDASAIERKIRAFRPWPGAYTTWTHNKQSMNLKILSAEAVHDVDLAAGIVENDGNGAPLVGTAKGSLRLLEVLPQGKKPMSGAAFLRGYSDFVGSALGETKNDA